MGHRTVGDPVVTERYDPSFWEEDETLTHRQRVKNLLDQAEKMLLVDSSSTFEERRIQIETANALTRIAAVLRGRGYVP